MGACMMMKQLEIEQRKKQNLDLMGTKGDATTTH